MSRRMGSAPRRREGTGLGERLSESFIFILMGVGLVAAGYWYFMVYMKSPKVALQGYLSAVNSGNPEAQYGYLAESSKSRFTSKDNYSEKWPFAYGLSARIATFTFKNSVLSGDTWSTDVDMSIRKKTAELLNTATDNYTDHYELHKESDGWKIVMEKCKIDLTKAENNR